MRKFMQRGRDRRAPVAFVARVVPQSERASAERAERDRGAVDSTAAKSMSVTTTLAPSCGSASAAAPPIPTAPPVTKATLPWSRFIRCRSVCP